MTFDSLNDTSDPHDCVKIEDNSSSSAQLQHFYHILQEQGGADSNAQPHQNHQFGNSSSNNSQYEQRYRDAPDDNTTLLPFNGMQGHNDMSLLSPDEATSFILSPQERARPDNEYDSVTVSSLLGQSDRMHITEENIASADPFLDTHDYQTSEFESPRKMSRVDVDKLFSIGDESAQTDGFMFTKFGAGALTEEKSSSKASTRSIAEPNITLPPGESISQFHADTIASNHPSKHIANQQQQQQILLSSTDLSPGHHQQHHQQQQQQQMSNHNSSGYSNATLSEPFETTHMSLSPSARSNRRNLLTRVPSLSHNFPDKHNNISLQILTQPETQHRARYMTEGSRGAVKDALQQGHPVIQLNGWDEDVRVEMFIGTDTGKVKPHGFYQACRVSGKNSTPCKEREVDGTVVIEMDLERSKNSTATIDCVGILKLRNTDVEKRIGLLKTKKKSTRCRMVFRVNLTHPDGGYLTLQTVSNVINCTQPAGQPEISKMSLDSSPFVGGQDLFVIGKNFVKGFVVKFQEVEADSDNVIWEKEAEVDSEYTHSSHFICCVPAYKNENFYGPVNVQLVVEAAGGSSEPVPFTYNPVMAGGQYTPSSAASCSTPQSTTATNSSHNSPKSFIAPEALELVAQLQQQTTSGPSGIFRIPEGVDFISQDQDSQAARIAGSRIDSSNDYQEHGDISMRNSSSNCSSQPMDSGMAYTPMTSRTDNNYMNQH